MPVLSATDCYVAQLHSMSMKIPTMARGNFRKIKKGQEVKSDILNATLNVLRCTIQTVKKNKNPPLQSTPPPTRPSPTPTTRRNERRRSETPLPPSPLFYLVPLFHLKDETRDIRKVDQELHQEKWKTGKGGRMADLHL